MYDALHILMFSHNFCRRRKNGRKSAIYYVIGTLILRLAICDRSRAFLLLPATTHHTVARLPPLWNSKQAPELSDHAPSWKDLHLKVLETPTGKRLEKEARLRRQGLGPPHTDAPFRLFCDDRGRGGGEEEDEEQIQQENDIRVTLYRDHAGWCPYCQKVWLALEIKKIPYRVEKVPMNAYGLKPAWYTRQVDGGKLPAIKVDGMLHVESLEIIKLLERVFPSHSPQLIPDDDNEKSHQFAHLMELEQELQRAWFSLVFYPTEEDSLHQANQTLLEVLTKVDDSLVKTDGPWFLGGPFPSLVDIQFVTQIERIFPSVLYWKGYSLRHCPELANLISWLESWEQLPCYLASRSDYYTLVMVMPSQNGPGFMIPESKKGSLQICGLLGSTWNLPLNWNDSLEPFPELKNNNEDDFNPCHEASFYLIGNHVNVVRFACRGAGETGNPSFQAELADPFAEPDENYVQAVDICLRHVARAAIEGYDNTVVVEAANKDLRGQAGNDVLRDSWEAYQDDDFPPLEYYWNWESGDVSWTPPTQQLDTCLMYLRDRIGVPRDMSSPAAMCLRSYLNWAIDILNESNL